MGMSLDEVYEHYNSLDPARQISRNSSDSVITTTTYSQFKTICGLTEVRMAEFKTKIFECFGELAEIVGNRNAVIRIGKKSTYFEVYDVIFVNLDEEKLNKIEAVLDKYNLSEQGYVMLVLDFELPKKEGQEVCDLLVTLMIKYVPASEKPTEFFGYII